MNVLPWIPDHVGAHYLVHGCRAKHSQSLCTFERSPGVPVGRVLHYIWGIFRILQFFNQRSICLLLLATFLLHKSVLIYKITPWWLSWMRRPTGDQEATGSTPAEVGNILSWRLIMKYFLLSFSPFRWFKKGSCQFLAKECAQYWLTA